MDYGTALIWAVGIGAIVGLSLYGRHKWATWRANRRAAAQAKRDAAKKTASSSA